MFPSSTAWRCSSKEAAVSPGDTHCPGGGHPLTPNHCHVRCTKAWIPHGMRQQWAISNTAISAVESHGHGEVTWDDALGMVSWG